jgi:diacylglycerol kinase (ATP)
MNAKNTQSKQPSGMRGKGGITRIVSATKNSLRGLCVGMRTEAAIQQEMLLLGIALPVSYFIADGLWTWVALMVSLLVVLAAEFLNSAIEELCDHLHPGKHEAIGITKDYGSAGVFFALLIVGLVWGAALLRALGIV